MLCNSFIDVAGAALAEIVDRLGDLIENGPDTLEDGLVPADHQCEFAESARVGPPLVPASR